MLSYLIGDVIFVIWDDLVLNFSEKLSVATTRSLVKKDLKHFLLSAVAGRFGSDSRERNGDTVNSQLLRTIIDSLGKCGFKPRIR